MRNKELSEFMENSDKLNKKIKFYLNKRIITPQKKDKFRIQGHIKKARHNLYFVQETSEEKYPDWILVGCYYAVYQASLSLILNKEYYSKNHDATLCLLIKYYNDKGLVKEDLELLNQSYLTNEDMLFYLHVRNEREKASYSTRIVFDRTTLLEMKKKAINFVNRVSQILEKK